MILSTIVGVLGTETVASLGGAGIVMTGAFVGDTVLLSTAGDVVKKVRQGKDAAPQPWQKLAEAQSLCNVIHWEKRKALQMAYQAQKLVDDEAKLDRTSKSLTAKIRTIIASNKGDMAKWERNYRTNFPISIAVALALVVFFLLFGSIKGTTLRNKLEVLRQAEANAGYGVEDSLT